MNVPPTHVVLRAGGVRVAVRRDLADELGALLLARRLRIPAGAEPLAGGRGGAFRLRLRNGLGTVVRSCRRGGLLARLVRETYLGVVARPWRELAVAHEARRRGVPTPEVLAARVVGRGMYRGAVVTAEVEGGVPLVEALRAAGEEMARTAIAAAAGAAVAKMHRAGLMHRDLNATNVLVRTVPGCPPVAVVIDLDRARLCRGPLAPRQRRAMLARLARSLEKLDPGGALSGSGERTAFRGAYEAALGEPCGC